MKMSEKKKTIFLTGNITKEELNVLERLVEKRYGSEVEIDKSPNLVIEDDWECQRNVLYLQRRRNSKFK